jgi:murein L,D-transpeptidase YcbB/YkuD
MQKNISKIFLLSLTGLVFLSGCATTKARQADSTDVQSQVAELQAQVQAKDLQIQDLQAQVESRQQSLDTASNVSPIKSSKIRVPGVTVKDVQQALIKAGYNPGPVDGEWGKKTRGAIQKFQRRKNLKADGIVGEKTWSLLNS